MAQVSNFQMNGRILEWKTKVPSSSTSFFNSPTFRLLGSKWYLQFSHSSRQHDYDYCTTFLLDITHIVSLVPKVSLAQTLHTPFSVVAYIGHLTDRSQTPVALKWCQIAERKRIEIWKLLDSSGEYNDFISRIQQVSFNSVGEVRIVCLFHDGDSSGKLVEKSVQVSQEVPRDIESLSDDLSHLLEKEILPDVRLECGGRTYRAHRSVLGARSEVFRAMFQNETLESETGAVKVQDMDAEVLQKLLKFAYTGKPEDIRESTAADLYEAADKYNVHSLKAACTYWIERNLNAKNWVKYLVLADSHSDAGLKATAMSFILKNPGVLKSDDWRTVASSDLTIEVFQTYVAATVK